MSETDKDIDTRKKEALKVGDKYKDKDGTVWYRTEQGTLMNKSNVGFYGVRMFCPECEAIMGGKESKLTSLYSAAMTLYCCCCRLSKSGVLPWARIWATIVKSMGFDSNRRTVFCSSSDCFCELKVFPRYSSQASSYSDREIEGSADGVN